MTAAQGKTRRLKMLKTTDCPQIRLRSWCRHVSRQQQQLAGERRPSPSGPFGTVVGAAEGCWQRIGTWVILVRGKRTRRARGLAGERAQVHPKVDRVTHASTGDA
eukprot:COSAG06_NODE_9104_length_1985_cov_1.864263_5_plen_105_part_00